MPEICSTPSPMACTYPCPRKRGAEMLAAILVAISAALVWTWVRQKRLSQQLDALRVGLDQIRIDVAQLKERRDTDDDGDGDSDGGQPRIVRRKKHLGLVGSVAAGIGVSAAWAKEHRTAIAAGTVAVAASSALLVAPWPWDRETETDPPSAAPSGMPSLPTTSAHPSTHPAETIHPTVTATLSVVPTDQETEIDPDPTGDETGGIPTGVPSMGSPTGAPIEPSATPTQSPTPPETPAPTTADCSIAIRLPLLADVDVCLANRG